MKAVRSDSYCASAPTRLLLLIFVVMLEVGNSRGRMEKGRTIMYMRDG